MKKAIFIITLLLANTFMLAQNGFNYKALITDNGNALNTQQVTFKFTVLENGSTAVYQETQTATTDTNGIVAVNVGEGTVVSGDFSTIDWGSNPYFLKVEIDTGSGYQDFGTTEFKYVPYAKYAEKAGNVFSGDFNDLNNIPTGLSDGDDDTHLTDSEISAMGYIKDANDADHDPANEIQTISKTGNTITLSNGGGSVTDTDTHLSDADISAMGYIKDANDADHDATNELQDLSLSGTQLSITNGTGVDFTNWDTDSTDDVQAINDLSDAKTTANGIFLGSYSGSNSNNNILTGIGSFVMPNITTADYDIGIGNASLNSLTSGQYNVVIGHDAGYSITTGDNNTFIGDASGYYNTGENNTFIGSSAGGNNNGSGNIFIGKYAGLFETGSNKLYIENSSSSTPLIGGDFSTDEVTINGSLSIKDGTEGDGKVLVSDANGKGHWADIASPNKVLSLGAMNVITLLGSNQQYINRDYNFGAYCTSSTIQLPLIIPINLPEDAVLTGITVYYKDNTTDNYKISVMKYSATQVALGNFGSYTTNGASNNFRTKSFSFNLTVDSGYQYFVKMEPAPGSNWTGNSSSILKGIKVYYTE